MSSSIEGPVLVGDIGGTNFRVGVATPERVWEKSVEATPEDADMLFAKLGEQILYFSNKYNVNKGAIAFAGKVEDEHGDYQVGPLPHVAGITESFDLSERLAFGTQAINNLRLLPLNDAVAQTHMAARKYAINENVDPLLFLTISTGVGGGVCHHNQVRAIEPGHIPIFRNGMGLATVEQRVSGEAISQLYGRSGEHSSSDLYEHGPDSMWAQVGKDLGFTIGVLVPVEKMSQVVLGGSIAAFCNRRFARYMKKSLKDVMESLPKNMFVKPEIKFVPRRLDADLALRGCSIVVEQSGDLYA